MDKKKILSIDRKFRNEKIKCERLTNNELVCKNCLFALDDFEDASNTYECKKYLEKPDKVLSGGECIERKDKNQNNFI